MSVECVKSQVLQRDILAGKIAAGPRKSGCDALLVGEEVANQNLMNGANSPNSTGRHSHRNLGLPAGPRVGFGDTIHAGGALA